MVEVHDATPLWEDVNHLISFSRALCSGFRD